MKIYLIGLLTVFFVCTTLMSHTQEDNQKYKCLIQLKNYQGEGAYVVVSVVNKDNDYQKTLRVLGDDHEWYPDLTAWDKFREANRFQPRLDGVTGASIGSGERAIVAFTIDSKYIDNGYHLRFETAVEDKLYHEEDLMIELTSEYLKTGKFSGKEGYIRMVRLIPLKK